MAETPGVVVACDGVSFAYDRPLFADVNLQATRWSMIAILGPSGAGKSTLLSVIGGLLRPDNGTVHYQRVHRTNKQIPIAWIFQTSSALGNRSALENICLPRVLRGERRSEVESLAAPMIDALGLTGLDTRKCRHLSGGELQRVGVARALLSDAPLLLADEPTGQLDSNSGRLVINAMKSVASDRATIVVTHDHAVAESCDQAFLLSEGGGLLPWP